MNMNKKEEPEEKKPSALKELNPKTAEPRVITPKNYVVGKGGGCVGSISNGVFGNYSF